MNEVGICPVCGVEYPVEELEAHASDCDGVGEEKVDKDLQLAMELSREEQTAIKADEEFAKLIQQQEEQKRREKSQTSTLIKCQKCSTLTDINSLYILDECGHKFCQQCLKDYVQSKIQVSVTLNCPIKDCGKELSVRDMKDLLPKIQKKEHGGPFNPTEGTGKATERIMSEFKHIMKSQPEKNGYSVKPVEDNIYKWELKLFDFDPNEPLGQDMGKLKKKYILLHVTFPPSYPFHPPYIRVIKPRFQFRTGHVTVGGSICMESLTNSGWSPANSLEGIIVSIRAQLIAGGARLDPTNKHDYTEQEAKDAFDRMVREHGW